MTPTPRLADDPSTLLELLDQQHALYQRLKELTEHQSMMVAQQKAESLLEVLAQRQGVLDQIDDLNQRLAPYREQWPTVRDGLDAPLRERVDQRVLQVEHLLAAIIDQDDQDRRRLQADHARVSSELGQTRHAGVAIRAYRQASGYSAASTRQHQG